MTSRKRRKKFFSEAKNQKTFIHWSVSPGRCHQPTAACLRRLEVRVQSTREKFFGSFFQKRTSFLPLAFTFS
jgi:hypothetical protein